MALAVLNAQDQTAVGTAIPEVVIAETVPQSEASAGADSGAQSSSWFNPTPAGYSELDEADTDDDGDGADVIMPGGGEDPNPTTRIRIPHKCYIYVITTTGRQHWMLPGVYVGTQFGDGLSECHVGLRPPIACQPACMKARDMGHALSLCREHAVPAVRRREVERVGPRA